VTKYVAPPREAKEDSPESELQVEDITTKEEVTPDHKNISPPKVYRFKLDYVY
jgi:hypothetical protein